MTKIKEDYVSFEIAKLLKEKGFDEYCYKFYDYDSKEIYRETLPCCNSRSDDYSAPTLQMAMKWLREEKNIFIIIEPHMYDYVNERNASYVCSLWIGDNYYENPTSTDFPSYEQAVEVALKYTLKNLI